MRATAGTARAVIVQPTPYGEDPSVILDALAQDRGNLRGIVAASGDVDDACLAVWQAAGVCGLRFVGAMAAHGGPMAGAVTPDRIPQWARHLRERQWHSEIWTDLDRFLQDWPMLEHQHVPVVLDHMGGFDVRRGVRDPAFLRLLALLREGAVWVKLVLCRRVAMGSSFDALRPFHDELIEANPNQLLWGSDWPFVRMGAQTPDVGQLLRLFLQWVGDRELIERILVQNPQRRYHFGAMS